MSLEQPSPCGPSAVGRIADAFFYARTPMLLVDVSGVIIDLNAAFRELFGADAAGCRGQHFAYLVNRLRPKIDGDFLPPRGTAIAHFQTPRSEQGDETPPILHTEDLNVAAVGCNYHSSRFGLSQLRVSELPRIDTASGMCAGSVISVELCYESDAFAFRAAVDRRLSHEVMWEVYAASYDRVLSEMPFYRDVLDRHCMALESAHVRTVLDVGAGTGIPTLRLLQMGKQVTAVDISRAMLQKLRSKVSQHYAGRLAVIEDTAESLPHLPDASFDGVSVLLAFFDMNDPLSALRESQRLLKPGGILIITDPRACFNVDELMTVAEESLREKGLIEELARDWQQIETIAPLIRDTISEIQTPTSATELEHGWNAEAIFEILRRDRFGNLTFRESHLGNCATITGNKPSCASDPG